LCAIENLFLKSTCPNVFLRPERDLKWLDLRDTSFGAVCKEKRFYLDKMGRFK
jgi:hypothetical protein